MLRLPLLLLLAVAPGLAAVQSAHELAAELESSRLDPGACYHVSDLRLSKHGLSIYFNAGSLIFATPVHGIRPGVYFSADPDGGDGEVLLLPPNRAERLSLSRFTGAPNLDAHFRTGLMIFSDNTAAELEDAIRTSAAGESPRKNPSAGAALSADASGALRNFYASFEVQLVRDLLARSPEGFFVLAASGSKYGNFDALYESGPPKITLGQIADHQNQAFFNTWTSFPARRDPANSTPVSPSERVSRFSIDARLDRNLVMHAVTRATLETKEKMPVLSFVISSRMRVTRASVDGLPAEVYSQESWRDEVIHDEQNSLFLVVPSAPLEAGTHEVELAHEGLVIAQTAERVFFVGARGTWYPQVGYDLANFDITYRCPKELVLVSTGSVVEEREDAESRIVRTATSAPIRFAGFNLGDYQRVRVKRGDDTIELCANRASAPTLARVPAGFGSHLEAIASDIASAFEFMSSLFGPPPLRTVTISPIPGTFGQGFPGLVYLSDLAYLDPDQRPPELRTRYDQTFFSDLLQAHEIAHQWWGNLVIPASADDEWLMESLANYSALLYLEKTQGSKAVDDVLDRYRDNLLRKDSQGRTVDSAGPIVWGPRLQTSETPGAKNVITYEKGAWIMHMLRQRLGDRRFLAFLHALCDRYRRSPLSTEAFRQVAREFVPPHSPDPDLEGFFENWIYGSGIPALQLRYAMHGATLVGSVAQSEVDDDFDVWLPLSVQDASGNVQVQWIQTGGGPAEFSIPVKSRQARVSLPSGWLYTIRK